MKIETQTSSDLSHIAELIEHIHIAMLTTVEPGGALASRPMTPLEMDAEGALWLFIDLRSSQLAHRQAANLAFAHEGQGKYVSLSGQVETVTDRNHIDRLWTPMAKPWFPDGPTSPNLGLLKFIPHAADYWDSSSSRMVRAFSLIASAVMGKPVAMGEHGSMKGL